MAGTPVLLAPGVSGLPLSGADYNQNLFLIEQSFLGVDCYILTGLVPSIGTGFSVSVSAGTAVLGMAMTLPTFNIGGLTPNTSPLYLYLLQTGQGTFNATGIPPSGSLLLGTCVTGPAGVTSVAVGRASGRQQFVQPQALVPGGLAAGITSAGHPDGINLASWGATDAEGQALFGVLPTGAGGGGASLSAANVFTNANTFSQVPAAVTTHGVVNIGSGGFAGGGGGNFVGGAAGQLLALNSAIGYTGNLILAQVGGASRFYVDYQGTVITPGPGPGATTAVGLLSVGAAPFDAVSTGHFVGNGSGTQIAGNAAIGYNGNLIDLQLAGLSRFSVSAAGLGNVTFNDASTISLPVALQIAHKTTATAVNFIGVAADWLVQNGAGNLVAAAEIGSQLASVTAGAEMGTLLLSVVKSGTLTEGFRVQVNGANVQAKAPGEFAHTGTTFGIFSATPAAQPSSTTDIRLGLISLGLFASGGASPMNLNGGALTAGVTALGNTTVTGTHTVVGVQTVQAFCPNTRSVSATGAINTSDFAVYANALGGAITLTLPQASTVAGMIVVVKKTDTSANAVTVAAHSGDTTEGAASVVIGGSLGVVWLQSLGTTVWYLIKQ
jgi:hypothetical protein